MQELFAASPVTGPPTALHTVKSMYRTAEDPNLWYEKFLRDKPQEGGDRTSNELSTLHDYLWAAGSYKQLNLVAVASVEIQCHRVAVIIEAKNDPHPSWSTARFYGEGTQADLD